MKDAGRRSRPVRKNSPRRRRSAARKRARPALLWDAAAFRITMENSVLRNIAITVCGLIALFSPLFLWIAWDQAVFWIVLAVGCGAVVAAFLLVRMSPEERL